MSSSSSQLHLDVVNLFNKQYDIFDQRYRNLLGEINSNVVNSNQNPKSNIIEKTIIKHVIDNKWKKVFWEKNTVEPSMLRVPLIVLLFLILWGINVWLLDKSRIQYHSAIRSSVQASTIFFTAFLLLAIYAITMTFLSSLIGSSVAFGIAFFYTLLMVLFLLPLSHHLPGHESRQAFFRLLKLVFFPSNIITFPEVLLADALTSLSKVFKDFCITGFVIYCYFMNENIVHYHDLGIFGIAILSSLPFWIRVRQCWVQFTGASDHLSRLPVFLNIVKYCSAFPPIWLVAAQALGYHHTYLLTVIGTAATFNSLYSFAWDIIMDWGILSFSRTGRVYWRQRLLYHWSIYLFAIIINFFLRFAWKANRLPWFRDLHSSNLIFVLEIIEVIRRSMWNMLRIEWEVLVQQEKLLSVKDTDISSSSNSSSNNMMDNNNSNINIRRNESTSTSASLILLHSPHSVSHDSNSSNNNGASIKNKLFIS